LRLEVLGKARRRLPWSWRTIFQTVGLPLPLEFVPRAVPSIPANPSKPKRFAKEEMEKNLVERAVDAARGKPR